MYEELVERLRTCGNSLACNKCKWRTECDGPSEAMRKAADAIEELTDKNVGKWIPVTNRLPEPYMRDAQGRFVHYLVMLMDENLMLMASRTDKCWIYSGDGSRLKNVTHWMPLPSSPKEEV